MTIVKFPGVEEDPEDAIFCDGCGAIIPPERLEAIPNTTRCVRCSTIKRNVGFMDSTANKGVAPEIIIVDGDDEESIRLAKRAKSDSELGRR